MPNRNVQEWIRMSQRTPGIFIFGLVLSPCGWVLDLVATVAPSWRTLSGFNNQPSDYVLLQGIWDICASQTSSSRNDCGQKDVSYYKNALIPIAQGLMVASLVITLIGLAVAIPGVRCWRQTPNWTAAGLGGLLIFCSGVLTIIPISWYTHMLRTLNTDTPAPTTNGKNRGEIRVDRAAAKFNHRNQPPRRMDVPSLSRPRSEASSVPYSKESMDDDVSFPRAKSPARSVNTLDSNPFDADL
uniref:Uncharacterized protein n=1 Tax=Knipowitschia caucasica TaxID=637954 RepID=A0AAV2J1F2_KNICA